jgi:hypothetical protein
MTSTILLPRPCKNYQTFPYELTHELLIVPVIVQSPAPTHVQCSLTYHGTKSPLAYHHSINKRCCKACPTTCWTLKFHSKQSTRQGMKTNDKAVTFIWRSTAAAFKTCDCCLHQVSCNKGNSFRTSIPRAVVLLIYTKHYRQISCRPNLVQHGNNSFSSHNGMPLHKKLKYFIKLYIFWTS